jgi:hypothetical protein
MTPADTDHQRAAQERAAREHLLTAGASSLPRPPWLHAAQPPSPVDLVRFAVWRGQAGDDRPVDIEAALALVPSARSDVEALESALVFLARSHGMAWSRIARAMGLGSAQAAQQRFDRVSGRTAARTESRP